MKLAAFILVFLASLCSAFAQTAPPNRSPTYSVETLLAAPYATPTDLSCISGANGKVIRIWHIRFRMQATAAVNATVYLVKRSTLNTGGTPTTLTPVTYDSNDQAAAASVVTFGAAPSALGTVAGVLRQEQIVASASASGWNSYDLLAGEYPFVDYWYHKTVILRSGTEQVCVNFNGAAVPSGGVMSYGYEWTEN